MTAHIIPVRSEFSGIADIYAHARAVRSRIFSAGKKPVKHVISTKKQITNALPLWERTPCFFDEHVIEYRIENALQKKLEPVPDGETLPARMTVNEIVVRFLQDRPGYKIKDLKSHNRSAKLARIRQEAMFEVKIKRPDLSYPSIGRWFGGRDHTTVLYGVKKIAAERGVVV